MERQASGAISAGSNTVKRKTSLAKKNTSSEDLSTSPTDPLRRPQRRTSSASSASTTNQNVRSHNGAVEDPHQVDSRRCSRTNGEENHLSINPTYKIPILGYEVMEERAKFTVSPINFFHLPFVI